MFLPFTRSVSFYDFIIHPTYDIEIILNDLLIPSEQILDDILVILYRKKIHQVLLTMMEREEGKEIR
jgi:hypothetical protein